ncbi:hypothetical protein [Algoriphagus vanfongensis]|uniref:hypothetical protein n=1 Tax=Algoriphagus vanfongensis TaxID=426371 RepID=UPI0004023731|nr:hypothetical protein [Algoriphagus vanfongensis]
MNYRFGKFFYFVSIIFFLLFLLYFYAAMSDQVLYSLGENGAEGSRMDKNTFFYGMIIGFLLLNAFSVLPPKMLETKASKNMHRLFPIGDKYRDYLLTWFYSFGGILNVSLAIVVFYIHSINNQEEIGSDQFSFFFYLIPALLVIWIIALFVLFAGKAKQMQKGS